jgi:predicted DCC family thiol-disulfide oxidoreductase YuxK
MSTPPPTSRVIVLFDDGCGLCSGAVGWLASRDGRRALRFAPLSGETARPYLAAAGAATAGDCQTLVLVEGGGGEERIFVRSAAVGRALRHVGGAWGIVGRLLAAMPRRVADRLYCMVSQRRGRGADSADRLPPWLRGRMLR